MKKWEQLQLNLSITQNLKRGKAIIRIKHKICYRQRKSELSDVKFYRFCSEGTSEVILFLECLQ